MLLNISTAGKTNNTSNVISCKENKQSNTTFNHFLNKKCNGGNKDCNKTTKGANTYKHRENAKEDLPWSIVSNSLAFDEFLSKLGWTRTHDGDKSDMGDNSIVHLEMMAELNKRKLAIKYHDADDIGEILNKCKSKSSWAWIGNYRPLSNKWMLSSILDNITNKNNERFHCRGWTLSSSHTVKNTKVYKSIGSIIKDIKAHELRQKQNNNINDWLPGDGYYIKNGATMSGGGENIKFVTSLKALENYLQEWLNGKRRHKKLNAFVLVQQAIANRRRMVFQSSIFELRVMCVITGGAGSAQGEFEETTLIEPGSVYVHDQMRVKTLPFELKTNNSNCNLSVEIANQEGVLLNKRQIMKQRNTRTSWHFHEMIDAMNENDKHLIKNITIPKIINAMASTASSCCHSHGILPNKTIIVAAFDFIIDCNGNPMLLEVNVKPWLRWCGVRTREAYPDVAARVIAEDFLHDFLRLFDNDR